MAIDFDKYLDELVWKCAKVFIGIGAHKGEAWCQGEDAVNVYSAVRIPKMINSGEKVALGSRVADAVRSPSATPIWKSIARF